MDPLSYRPQVTYGALSAMEYVATVGGLVSGVFRNNSVRFILIIDPCLNQTEVIQLGFLLC